ncbi:MAG: hypothetical protein CM1200mP9_08460 [Gammaproteobacteria bacterium]|nr:MAG: hypothetical protein CM1200mP9_08460 [Gammaproteobacteria bacterium]
MITSLQNARVKQVVRLRQRRHRGSDGLFLIEGYREIRCAVDARIGLKVLFTCEQFFSHSDTQKLVLWVWGENADIPSNQLAVMCLRKYRSVKIRMGYGPFCASPAGPDE